MRRFVSLFFLGLFVVACLVLAGCSGGGGGGVLTDAQGNLVETEANTFVLKPNVKELPDDGSVTVGSVTDGTIVLTGDVPPLEPGDIVIKNEGDQQFLRKVVSVSTEGGVVTVETGPAVLTDVFETAEIEQTINLGPEFLRQLQPALAGVSFGQPELVQSRGEEFAAWSLPIHFGDAVLTTSGRGSLVGNGDVTLRLALFKALSIGTKNLVVPTVNHFALVPKVTVEGNLRITGKGTGDFAQEFPLTPEFSYPLAGFGPVGLNLTGQLKCGVDGFVQADGELAMNGRVSLEGGIEAVEDQWNVVGNLESGFDVTPPQMEANATLNVNLLSPRFGIGLLGMGSAWVDADMLRLETEAAFRADPAPQYEVVVYRTFRLDCGAHLTLGVPPLAVQYDGSFDLFNAPREEIARVGTPIANPATAVKYIVPSPADASIQPGEWYFIIPIAYGPNPDALPISNLNLAYDFTNSNPQAVKLTDYGWAAMVEGLAGGESEVRITSPSGLEARSQVTCVGSALQSVELRQDGADGRFVGRASPAIPERGGRQFQAIGHYADGSEADLTYSSSWSTDNAAAGLTNRGGAVRGRGEGTFTLQVQTDDGQSTSVELLVQRPLVERVSITPLDEPTVQMTNGESRQLQALGWYADGSQRYVTQDLVWLSFDESVATVDGGLVTSVGPGVTEIAAVDNRTGYFAKKRLEVGPAMTGLSVSPGGDARHKVNTTQQFQAEAQFEDGSTRDVTALVAWSCDNPYLGAFAGSNGNFSFKTQGVGRVKALYNGFTASSGVLDVRGPAGFRFSVQPADVEPGQSFSVEVQVLDSADEVWPDPVQVNLELAGGPPNANLAGTLTRTSSGGTATFPGLSVDQIGTGYSIRAFSYGMTVKASDSFQATAPSPGHVFVNDRQANGGTDALHVFTLAADGTFAETAGSPYDTTGRAEGMVRLGDYVYVVTSAPSGEAGANNIDAFGYERQTGALTKLGSTGPGATGSFQQPIELETNGSDALFALAHFDRTLYAFRVDGDTGNLTRTDDLAFDLGDIQGSQPNRLTFHDVPESTIDYLFVGDQQYNAVHVFRYDAVAGTLETVAGSPFENSMGPGMIGGGSPLKALVVGDHLYAVNPVGDAISRWAFDDTTGQLTAVPGVTATGTEVGVRPVSMHTIGQFLYVGTEVQGTIYAYRVEADGSLTALNGGNPYPAGDTNVHAFADVALTTSTRALYVAASARLTAFAVAADGLLSEITPLEPLLFWSPGAVRH